MKNRVIDQTKNASSGARLAPRNRVRTATVNALLKEDSLPKFGELAAQDLAGIWDLGHDGNRNHKRTWRAARKQLRLALEKKCDIYYSGWKDHSKRETWLKAIRFRDQILKDITDMASLIVSAPEEAA